jgi:hypothetical protein
MNKYSKFIAALAIAGSAFLTNCKSEISTGSPVNGLIFANYIGNLIKTATSGNCAISVNLGSLYAGAILQGAANSTTNFTQAQYEAASGSTITAQGYTLYSQVPFNKKYDAFLGTGGTTWTETTRNTSLANQKVSTDVAAFAGAALILTSTNTSAPPASIFNNRTSATDALTTFWNSFSAAEQTAIATGMGTSVATLNGALTLTGTFQATAHTVWGAVLCNAGGAAGQNTSTACGGNVAAYSAGASAVGNAYNARLAWRAGHALLACARIPRSNCTFSALTTASRAADIAGAVSTFDAVFHNGDCRKTAFNFGNSLANQLFVGLPFEVIVNGFNSRGPFQQASRNSATSTAEGSTTNFQNNKILAEGGYPKSSALQNLGQSFTSAFPLREGTTAYPVTTGTAVPTSQTANNSTDATAVSGTIPWRGGSNTSLTVVDSCESLGLGGFGPSPLRAGEDPANISLRRPLSDVKEIVYAFSTAGTAASEYATINGVTYTTITNSGLRQINATSTTGLNDAIACNRSMRKRTPISALLNVGTTLNDLQVPSGDGEASSLLTACIYGGTSSTRAAAASLLASSVFNISECPAAAASGAARFGEWGLSGTGTAGFPNGRD